MICSPDERSLAFRHGLERWLIGPHGRPLPFQTVAHRLTRFTRVVAPVRIRESPDSGEVARWSLSRTTSVQSRPKRSCNMTDPVWYYARGDVEKGPLSIAQMRALAAAGKILGQCRYVREISRRGAPPEWVNTAIKRKRESYREQFVAECLHRLRRLRPVPLRECLAILKADPWLAVASWSIGARLSAKRLSQDSM